MPRPLEAREVRNGLQKTSFMEACSVWLVRWLCEMARCDGLQGAFTGLFVSGHLPFMGSLRNKPFLASLYIDHHTSVFARTTIFNPPSFIGNETSYLSSMLSCLSQDKPTLSCCQHYKYFVARVKGKGDVPQKS